MATLAQNSLNVSQDFNPLKAIVKFLGDLGRAGHAAARYQQLASMTDGQLSMMGTDREHAARVAYEESFGKL